MIDHLLQLGETEMTKLFGLATGLMLAAMPAVAQVNGEKTTIHDGVVKTTERLKTGTGVEKITCKSFNALDESFKPQAVAYAVDYSRKGKPKDASVDVAGTEQIAPAIITDCKAHPEETLLARIKAGFHRH